MSYRDSVRKRNLLVLLTLALSALGLFLYWWVTHPRSEQEAVRRVLAAMEQAAERKHFAAFMRHLSDLYTDEAGYTKRTIGQLVFRACQTHDPYEVVLDNPKIAVVGKNATVEATLEILVQAQLRHRLHVSLKLQKELWGGWQVTWSDGWHGIEGE